MLSADRTLIKGSARRGPLARGLLLAALALLAGAASAAANLEERMKYERSLEQKVEEVLANLLGPGKSRVMISATLDFSTRESVKMESEAGKGPEFGWGEINKSQAGSELLPGFSDDSAPRPVSGSYQKETAYPQAMVKRLTVSLVLSDNVPEEMGQKVRQVISDLLVMDTARGDQILVTRARFAPIWYTSEMLSTAVKYGVVGLIAIVGMIIVSVGFLKMASAMRSMEGEEGGTNIRMEMAASGGGEPGGAEPAGGGFALPQQKKKEEPAAEEQDGVVFNVKPDKLEILVRMLAKDDPADIAIVAAHLPQALQPRFMAMLPPEVAAGVVASVARVRFLEPEMLNNIKEDLEHRLEGSIGGYGKAAEMIERAGFRMKKAVLEGLEKSSPEVAAALREKIFLIEDLERFSDRDFSIIAMALPVEGWAAAVCAMSQAARDRLKKELPERTWQMIEQVFQGGPAPEEKIEEAVAQLGAAVLKLISEGRIGRPAQAPLRLTAPEAAKPA